MAKENVMSDKMLKAMNQMDRRLYHQVTKAQKLIMKTIWILTILFGSFAVSAQTSVIGIKSHHGDMKNLSKSVDKFGVIMPMPIYDSLIRISGDCVIQIGEDNGFGQAFRDTVCDHWYYQHVNFDEEQVRQFHGGNVVMVDFDEAKLKQKIENAQRHDSSSRKQTRKQSSEWLFVILVLSGLSAYIIRPARLWKK